MDHLRMQLVRKLEKLQQLRAGRPPFDVPLELRLARRGERVAQLGETEEAALEVAVGVDDLDGADEAREEGERLKERRLLESLTHLPLRRAELSGAAAASAVLERGGAAAARVLLLLKVLEVPQQDIQRVAVLARHAAIVASRGDAELLQHAGVGAACGQVPAVEGVEHPRHGGYVEPLPRAGRERSSSERERSARLWGPATVHAA